MFDNSHLIPLPHLSHSLYILCVISLNWSSDTMLSSSFGFNSVSKHLSYSTTLMSSTSMCIDIELWSYFILYLLSSQMYPNLTILTKTNPSYLFQKPNCQSPYQNANKKKPDPTLTLPIIISLSLLYFFNQKLTWKLTYIP